MKNNFFKALKKIVRSKRKYALLVYGMVFAYFVFFSYFSIAEHLGLKTQMNDLGNMDQAIYTTTKGDFMVNSTFFAAEGKTKPSIFAKHSFFTLLFFVPFYLIYSDPQILLLFQSAFVALGALPLFWLGRKLFGKNSWISIVTPFAYLVNPTVHAASLYDFHPVTVVMSLIIFAFYFLYTKRYKWFYILALIIALSKEDMPLIVVMLGLYMFFVQKERLKGALVSILASFYFVFIIKLFIPYFSSDAGLVFVSQRYSYLGDGIFLIIKNLLFQPRLFFELLTLERVIYLVSLLLPVLYLPLFSLEVFLISLPSFMINLLSVDPMVHNSFNFHYSAPILALIFIATTFSLSKLKARLYGIYGIAFFQIIVLLVLTFSVGMSIYYSSAPYSRTSSLREFSVSEHARGIGDLKELIQHNSPLTIQNNLGAHFSQRRYIYTFPYKANESDYVLLDLNDPFEVARFTPQMRNFIFITQQYPQEYYDNVISMFKDRNYGVIFYGDDGYLLFERGVDRDKNKEAFNMFNQNIKAIYSSYPDNYFNLDRVEYISFSDLEKS